MDVWWCQIVCQRVPRAADESIMNSPFPSPYGLPALRISFFSLPSSKSPLSLQKKQACEQMTTSQLSPAYVSHAARFRNAIPLGILPLRHSHRLLTEATGFLGYHQLTQSPTHLPLHHLHPRTVYSFRRLGDVVLRSRRSFASIGLFSYGLVI